MSKKNKTINFLYEASKILPNNELYTAIRSRMLTKCSTTYSSNSLTLDLVPRCDACGILFKDVPPINFIKPVKKPADYKRLANLVRNNTKYQTLSVRKFNKYKNNKQILITQCKVCKKQIKNTVNKFGHIRTKINQVNSFDELTKRKKWKNMKRKISREYSGLNKSAVLSVKRSLETEDNNNRSPKIFKKDADVVDLITPDRQKTNYNDYLPLETTNSPSPNISILTSNTIYKNVEHTSTPLSQDSDIICLDSPTITVKKFRNLNDMFTPIFTQNKTIIEISDTEVQNGNSTGKKKKKNKKNKKPHVQIIEQTPKIKNNSNVILVSEQSAIEKKKKKLNNLSNFLKNSTNIQKPKQNNTLQNFLSNFT